LSKLYHNPRCSKSRAALEYLQSNNISFTVIEYLNHPLTGNELKILCSKLEISPKNLIRVKDQFFKDLKIEHFNDQSEQFYFDLLENNPKLMERPIYETANQAAIGRPLDNIISIL
jgi:arsenate reductase